MRTSMEMADGPYTDIEKCEALELAMGVIADYPGFCIESVCSLFILHDMYGTLLKKNGKKVPEVEDVCRNFQKEKGKLNAIVMPDEVK